MTKVTLLHPATFALDGGAMFGIIPKPLWEKKIKADEMNRIPMALRVVLIQSGDKNILVDTGIGTYHPDKFNQQFKVKNADQALISALESQSLSPTDITDIILTHLHFDHVGGLTDGEGKSLFPQATIHLHKKHFEYAKNPTLRDSGSFQTHYFLPAIEKAINENKINWVEENEGCLLDGIVNYKTSFGHTPYMIHPIFDKFIYMADLVPMSHHVHVPWVMGYDIEPGVTTVYKQQFYDFILANQLNLIFEHDQDYWGGPLSIDEKNRYQIDLLMPASKEISQIISD